MKPRLYLFRGVWHCKGWLDANWHRCGLGFTPRAAYEDWLGEQDSREWEKAA